jgi:hypothetical protein
VDKKPKIMVKTAPGIGYSDSPRLIGQVTDENGNTYNLGDGAAWILESDAYAIIESTTHAFELIERGDLILLGEVCD